jgi:L-alanine-DL-glutamate epimerase-like enolase superfamily enzyme
VATELPASTVRFAPKTGLDSRVEASRTVTYPVTVEGAARGRNLKWLSVYLSYDDGSVGYGEGGPVGQARPRYLVDGLS